MSAPFSDLTAQWAEARVRDAEFRRAAEQVAALPRVRHLTRKGEGPAVVIECQGAAGAESAWHESGVLVNLLPTSGGFDLQFRREQRGEEVSAMVLKGAERGGVLRWTCAECGREHLTPWTVLLAEVATSIERGRRVADGSRFGVRVRA